MRQARSQRLGAALVQAATSMTGCTRRVGWISAHRDRCFDELETTAVAGGIGMWWWCLVVEYRGAKKLCSV